MAEHVPMDVAFFRYSLLNRGGDRVVTDYANYLAQLGNRVTIYVSVICSEFHLHPAIRLVLVPWKGAAGFLAYGAFHRLGHDLVIVDIIHLVRIVGFRNRVVYLAQADDVEYYGNPLLRLTVDALYRLSINRLPVISVSQELSDTLQSRYGIRHVKTVVNGIDLELFYPEPDPELLAVKQGRVAIFFLNRGDTFRKGIDLGIQVLQTLAANPTVAPHCEVWVCGDQFTELLPAVTIRNFGVVTDERLRRMLSSADIFLYPSRHEGFGLFPLEAMACGCAVVTTEAVPYASSLSSIIVSQVGDVAAMVKGISGYVTDRHLLAAQSSLALTQSTAFDVRGSREKFVKTLMRISLS